MKNIFELCVPRKDVLGGELKEDIFAARLKDVIDNTAEDVYRKADVFFDNTYPTEGLKTLLKEALGRLVGDATGKNAVIRLETAFGGGKTHNLIALYHVAVGNAPASSVSQLIGVEVPIPAEKEVRVAGLVGSDLDPGLGIQHPEDDLTTKTLWGELAYQLSGPEGFALVQESEATGSAPGTGLLERIVGDDPTLIMIDEIARHLRAALAVPTATGKSNLAEQTIAFLMSLLEFASSKERCLVVLTLAGGSDAFSVETEQLRFALSEAQSVSARQERVLTPTDETEIYAIVTHRLFKSIDRAAAKTVFDAYAEFYSDWQAKGADIPQRGGRAEYIQEMKQAYPFHPELLNTLNWKTATIPNFNQTRGALRLLAWTVRTLWEKQPAGVWMIHPFHLDLSQPKISEDLTARLDRPKFKKVIEADIVSPMEGTASHAHDVDQLLLAAGKPAYARRVATTIFLHSLTQGVASGVDPADVMLAVLQPDGEGGGDDPAVVSRTLERLYEQAWFLEYDGHRYRFKTEPSLNKIVADEMSLIGQMKAKSEIDRRIRQIWRKGFFQPVFFPVEAADVGDDAGIPKLAIIHYDAEAISTGDTAPPDLVRQIYAYAGAMESFRVYQNNVVFLVADQDQVDHLIQVAVRYQAIGRIVGDPERMGEFAREQRKELKKMYESSELDVRVAITKAYRYLFYPSQDAPKSNAYLRRETLPAQDQGDVDQDQTNVIVRILRTLEKVLTADDSTLSAAYVKARAWNQNQTSMTTEDLRKAFARKHGLRILLDVGQLQKTIANGVKTGIWIYYDSRTEFGYDKDVPVPSFSLGDDLILYSLEEAQRLNIRIKGKWKPPAGDKDGEPPSLSKCPVCGQPEDQCICGDDGGKVKAPAKYTGQGAAAQALQQIVDQCAEHDAQRLSALFISIEGMGKQIAADIHAIGLAIPQFGKTSIAVELDLTATYGSDQDREIFEQKFSGGWDRYKRLKTITDAFSQEADEVKATMRLGLRFDEGLALDSPQFDTIRGVLTNFDLGKVTVDAVPFKEEVHS